jgi:hypothetical protein
MKQRTSIVPLQPLAVSKSGAIRYTRRRKSFEFSSAP